MSPLRNPLFPFFRIRPKEQAKTRLYHKEVQEKDGYSSRIHLRVNPDGSGVLWVNANQTFYLNRTAAEFATYLFDDLSESEIDSRLRQSFPENYRQVKQDFETFSPDLKALLRNDGFVCDLCRSGIASEMPFNKVPEAPFRIDLAITYACNNDCSHCYNEKKRCGSSIPADQWKTILKSIADLGVPHVVFTGGEPTLMPELVDLIRYSESLGLITGMNTNGRRLSRADYMDKIADSGIDHIQITLESHLEAVHDEMVRSPGAWRETVEGIRNAVKSKAFVMTNTTLLRTNATEESVTELIDFLHSLPVKTVGLNALIYSGLGKTVDSGLCEEELPALLNTAQAACARNGQRLVWYTPTQYCHFDPIENGLGIKGCSAARYAMCVEPDGSVLPCQSWYEPVGNILTDPWGSIWNHPLCSAIRSREYIAEACRNCQKLQSCGGGCPLAAPFKPQVIPVNEIPACF